MSQKVLIIKVGYSEVLDRENNSRMVSLGDILRTTPLLHLYKENLVTWVTAESAFPLLENNPYIDRILPYDLTTVLQLESEEFDSVINLEKIPGICALADKIRARRSRYGFTFNSQTGKAEAYDKAFEILAVGADPELKRKNKKNFQEFLFECVGKKWGGEEYSLGYNSLAQEEFDIGLNTQIGQKWPTKAWPEKNWEALEKLLIKEGYSVTRQDKQNHSILSHLNNYMDWMNSCKLIVSNDSLGMHLGLALKKKVIGLFGPTPSEEIYFYNRGKAILPEPIPNCLPCFEGICKKGKNCMEDILPEKIIKEIKILNS
ncbi:MAG: glycosyltransferase family 9 protein [Nanoarchaeota archaeon]|nr:glycosyltransferase family 9 protein [Nanoarchaeota archaeon]